MNDRDQTEDIVEIDSESVVDEQVETIAPVLDMDVFVQLRDVVRANYLWQWDERSGPTTGVIEELTKRVARDSHFRLVGDVEVDEDIFEITLWLEDTKTFTLASVDILMLDSLQIDFSRCAIMARELTRLGLEYHLLTFGEDRAQQFHINIIGPRMQQIRDLGTLVAPAKQTFSA